MKVKYIHAKEVRSSQSGMSNYNNICLEKGFHTAASLYKFILCLGMFNIVIHL